MQTAAASAAASWSAEVERVGLPEAGLRQVGDDGTCGAARPFCRARTPGRAAMQKVARAEPPPWPSPGIVATAAASEASPAMA